MIRPAVIFCFIFLIAFCNVQSQTLFKRTYGFGTITEGRCVVQTFDHGYAVCGFTTPGTGGQTNFYLLKTDSNGVAAYQYSYGGNGIDQAFSLVQLPDSGFLLAGYSNSFSVNSDYDVCIVRTDKSGNSLWTKTFGTSDWDFIYDMQQSPDGNFILIGNTFGSGNGRSSGYVVKIDSNGNVIWEKFIMQNQLVNLKQLAVRADGSFVVCGNVSPSSSYPGDYFLAFMDASGNTISTKIIDDGKHESFNGIDFFSNGDLAVAGISIDSSDNNDCDEVIMRIDPFSNIIWSLPSDIAGSDDFNDLYVYNDTIYASGSNSSNGAGGYDFKILNRDQNNGFINGHTFGAAQNEFCYRAVRTNDAGSILVGSTTSFGPGQTSVFLVKTDSLFAEANNVILDLDNNYELTSLNVFPNPTTGDISIFLNSQQEKIQLRFYDSNGKLVLEKNSFEFPYTLSLPECKSGNYVLEIFNRDVLLRKKVIIVK